MKDNCSYHYFLLRLFLYMHVNDEFLFFLLRFCLHNKGEQSSPAAVLRPGSSTFNHSLVLQPMKTITNCLSTTLYVMFFTLKAIFNLIPR